MNSVKLTEAQFQMRATAEKKGCWRFVIFMAIVMAISLFVGYLIGKY